MIKLHHDTNTFPDKTTRKVCKKPEHPRVEVVEPPCSTLLAAPKALDLLVELLRDDGPPFGPVLVH